MTEYEVGYKQGQKDLIKKWKRWKFGLWFFKRQQKELDEFVKHLNLDIKDIRFKSVDNSLEVKE